MIICPKCGEMIFNWTCDSTESKGDIYYEYVQGECTSCHTVWAWTNVYKYLESIDITLIEERDKGD